MIKDYVKFVFGALRQRKVRSWLTMIGIFIGIAAVVSLISLSQGMQVAIEKQFASLGTDKLIVQAAGGGFGPPGAGVSVHLTSKDKKVIQGVKGVDLVVSRLIRVVKFEFKDEVRYSYAVTIPDDPDEFSLVVEANDYQIDQGRFPNKNSFEALVGANAAQTFFDKELELRNKVKIQGEEFKIVGILKKSGNPQQDSTFVLPEKKLLTILGINDEIDILPLRIESGEDPNIVASSIKKELRKFRNVEEGKEDFVVQSPQQIIATLNNILLIIQGVLVGLAAISLIVGGIGIMNTMYTAVLERTKEIGVLKAIGAKRSKILAIFLIESGFLGTVGGIIGITFGFIVSKLVEYAAFQVYGSNLISAHVSIYLILGTLAFSFGIGTLSGFFPALQAAKLHPVEALRK